jgi:hypothetical protein
MKSLVVFPEKFHCRKLTAIEQRQLFEEWCNQLCTISDVIVERNNIVSKVIRVHLPVYLKISNILQLKKYQLLQSIAADTNVDPSALLPGHIQHPDIHHLALEVLTFWIVSHMTGKLHETSIFSNKGVAGPYSISNNRLTIARI